MPSPGEIFTRYRLAGLAILASAAIHAAVFVGIPQRAASIDEPNGPTYTASLDPAAAQAEAPPAAAKPAPQRPRARRSAPIAIPIPVPLEPIVAGDIPVLPPEPASVAEAVSQPPPEKLAAAAPVAPPEAAAAPAPEAFPVEGLPSDLTIKYDLKSPVADARAEYHWSRDGDNYRITGEGEAVGFFQLFLEGRILQESSGTVTAAGLRPERFVEKKPGTADEGLEFDWPAKTVTFERGENRKTTALTDNTVDWLSMIFQLAHVPPPTGADSMRLRVFTQRKLYTFNLKVLGIEEIDIPLGKVRALHLRHVDPDDRQNVDVWLGVDQHYLPVKMRYPVARNRFMVEQSATRVTSQ